MKKLVLFALGLILISSTSQAMMVVGHGPETEGYRMSYPHMTVYDHPDHGGYNIDHGGYNRGRDYEYVTPRNHLNVELPRIERRNF